MCLFCPVKNHSFDYPPCLGSSALTTTLRIRRRALQIQREERVPLIGTHSHICRRVERHFKGSTRKRTKAECQWEWEGRNLQWRRAECRSKAECHLLVGQGPPGCPGCRQNHEEGAEHWQGQGQDDADTRPQRHPAHLSHLCGGLLTGSGQ